MVTKMVAAWSAASWLYHCICSAVPENDENSFFDCESMWMGYLFSIEIYERGTFSVKITFKYKRETG